MKLVLTYIYYGNSFLSVKFCMWVLKYVYMLFVFFYNK